MIDNDIPCLPAGTVLAGMGQYTIERVLGTGGFGITYLATTEVALGNMRVTTRVAVKEHFLADHNERQSDTLRVTTPGTVRSRKVVSDSLRDFLGEARRLQSVSAGQQAIVKVNEVFEANGTAYYVMEYLEGSTLWKAVEGRGMTEADMLGLLTPIVEAVAYLHANRLTHLDVKPQNIMLATEGAGVRPVLIDFGLSKHYDAEGHATSTINTLACSDGYSPSEQYSGITTFTPSADVYALGATMIACLTGQTPPKSTEWSTGDRMRYVDSMNISGPLRAALRGALADGTERLPDASALLAALPAAGAHRPYVAPAADNATRTLGSAPVSPERRSYKWLIVAAVAALLVATGAYIAFRGNSPAPTPLPAPADTTAIAANDAADDAPATADDALVGAQYIAPAEQNHTENERLEQQRLEQERIERENLERQQREEQERIDRENRERQQREEQERIERERNVWNNHRTPRNLYLAVSRGGNHYYFSESDWNALSSTQKNECTKQGVVIDCYSERFILGLYPLDGGGYNWNEAVRLYGNRLPNRKQGEAIALQYQAVKQAINAFGGSEANCWFWTKTEKDSSEAFMVSMTGGMVGGITKTFTNKIRAVAPVPVSAI